LANITALTGAATLHSPVQHSQIFNSIGGRHCISHRYAVAATSRRDPGDTMIYNLGKLTIKHEIEPLKSIYT
jgi:hypothetical protein